MCVSNEILIYTTIPYGAHKLTVHKNKYKYFKMLHQTGTVQLRFEKCADGNMMLW